MDRVLAALLFLVPLGAIAAPAPVVPAPKAPVSVTWHGQVYSRCISRSRALHFWVNHPGLIRENIEFFGTPVIATRNHQMAYICWREKPVFPTVPLDK